MKKNMFLKDEKTWKSGNFEEIRGINVGQKDMDFPPVTDEKHFRTWAPYFYNL